MNGLDYYLKLGIETETQRIVNEEAQAAAKRVEERVRGLVGSIATKVFSDIRMEQMGHDLVIRVQFPDSQQ